MKLTALQSSLLLSRIYRLMASTPDWQRWFTIGLEHLTVNIREDHWKGTEKNEKTASG